MTQNVIRILADWARHATHGVLTGLVTVPLEAGVTRLVTFPILDEVTDPIAAKKQIDADGAQPRLVLMTAATPVHGSNAVVSPYPGDKQVSVGWRFSTKIEDVRVAMGQCDQVERALARSMGRLFRVAGNEAARTRNGVQLTNISSSDTQYGVTNKDTLLTMTIILATTARDIYIAG